jgi:hypothetical protein
LHCSIPAENRPQIVRSAIPTRRRTSLADNSRPQGRAKTRACNIAGTVGHFVFQGRITPVSDFSAGENPSLGVRTGYCEIAMGALDVPSHDR